MGQSLHEKLNRRGAGLDNLSARLNAAHETIRRLTRERDRYQRRADAAENALRAAGLPVPMECRP